MTRGMGEAGQVPGIGWSSLALSFVSLGAVCVVAWIALRLLAGRGFGKATGAIRAPQVPPTQVLTGLALVLTLAVMAPTGERMLAAFTPVFPTLGAAAKVDLTSDKTVAALSAAAGHAKEPLREFLLKHTGPR